MIDSTGDSVTRWLVSLREGDGGAAENLWSRYFERLVDVARHRLGGFRRRVADEEDIAVSVFDTLVRGATNGRFPLLQDRRDLWTLLFAITKQKVAGLKRWEGRIKRGAGRVRGDSVFDVILDNGRSMSLDDLCGDEPTPQFVATLNDEHRHLLGLLRDETLQVVAQLTLEGYTTEEIARRLDKSVRTVQRKLLLIRATWSNVLVTD
jgi:DNA-directed RNA polymerase specialized sigma24 family protein